MADSQLADLEPPDALAALEQHLTETDAESASNCVLPAEPTVPSCDKCQTPLSGKQGWCRRCGWYPLLRTHVELDPWDREDHPQQKPAAIIETLRRFFPIWACKLLVGVGVILAISILARLLLPRGGSVRFNWTIAQMIGGEAVLMAGHLTAYLFSIMENDRLHLLDIILKPVAVWTPVFHALPATFWRVALGTWGMSAVLFSFIVGGLADKDMMDWGGKPARVNLLKAITDQAQQLAGDNQDGLENAIQDFVGKADNVIVPDKTPPKPKLSVDCLIIGYEPKGDKDFSSLILAAEVDGKLTYVGTLDSGIPPEVRVELNRRMPTLIRADPFVPTRLAGKWLQPTLVCRVSAKERSKDKKLVQPAFEELLTDISIGK